MTTDSDEQALTVEKAVLSIGATDENIHCCPDCPALVSLFMYNQLLFGCSSKW